MNKKFIILSFIVLFLILGGILVSFRDRDKLNLDSNLNINQNNKPNQNNQENTFVLYYGQGCPHCKIVEDFIKENNILAKIRIEQKEIYYNKDNALELLEKARICGINRNSVGVPFLWNGKECILGDKPIIDFLHNKLTEN